MFVDFIRRLRLAAAIILIFSISGVLVYASDFIPTNRDTRMPPARAVFYGISTDSYVFLGQFGDLLYYFREDRDIFLVEHVNGLFTWRTGLDAPFGMDVPGLVAAAQTEEERLRVAEPIEQGLNAIWTAFANSLISVELLDINFNTSRMSSAPQGDNAGSDLMEIDAISGHFRLDTWFNTPMAGELRIPVHIHLSGEGIIYNIFPDEITGTGANALAAIIFSPFMGASGGVRAFYDAELGRHGEPEVVPMLPGYIFVPDGSGALMRFTENTVNFNAYVGEVFGSNPAEATLNYDFEIGTVTRHHPLVPVFGVTHGYRQQGFVAWANEGAQYMEIIKMPHNNTTNYNFVYPRFVINSPIHQVYNRQGDGFMRLFPQRRRYNISMQYTFLQGNDASYAGMARAYRHHMINTGVLTPNTVYNDATMPVRVDFIMSDVRRSVLGRTDVVTTTASQVGDIVQSLKDSGVSSINGGLMGFQRGGITTGRPWAHNFTRGIGNRRAFTQLFNDMEQLGADISFAQDYLTINSLQMSIPRNQAIHMNLRGLVAYDSFEPFLPVNEISYARPQRSAQWITQQTNRSINMGAPSVTISGITNNLISHWGRRDTITSLETIELFQDTFDDITVPINAYSPNQYLWAHVDRFLQAPVFNTQFMIASDTVPFLQMVLHNTMEVYAPYANFSFYTQRDILRMIDYNVLPSFVLTHSPAHYLGNTNSLNFYSTEYTLYHDIIMTVYNKMSPIMSQVRGLEWLDRQVLAEGVVLNTYEGGVYVLINYTPEPFTHNGIVILAETARLIR